jgi:fibronectin type 3 domain-containing protein
MRHLTGLFIFFVLLANTLLHAQNDSLSLVIQESGQNLQATLKRSGSDILLRWAPADEGLWLNSLQGSVHIERLKFSTFKEFDPDQFERIAEKLRPWTLEQFEQAMAAKPGNDYLVMAGQSLYGEWETMDSSTHIDMGTIIQRREELRNKYSTAMLIADLDAQAATAMNLRYVDKGVASDTYLLYRITLSVPEYGIFETATALYNPNFNVQATPKIDAVEGLDGYNRLSWEREGHERYFTAYYIERSRDGKQFERIHELPYINAVDMKEAFGIPPITYLAEAENGVPYYYRIIGLDAFGELSAPSPVVQVMARDLTPPPAVSSTTAETTDQGRMQIRWQHLEPGAVTHYVVKRGSAADGAFFVISPKLPSTQLYYEDADYDPVYANFYEVCALDEFGNEACSLPFFGQVIDQEAPAPPSSLRGQIDSLGVVRLSWAKGTEPDLAGYHVFVANGANQVFTRINSQLLRDTMFLDTIPLNTLTEDIYYRIAAVDVRSNTSPMSEMLRLEKPDTIPPTPALFETYEVRDSSVWVRWVNSNSRDVVSHELERREGAGSWVLLQRFTGLETEFEDIRVQPSTNYAYRITALDDAGLRSKVVRDLELNTKPRLPRQLPRLALAVDENTVRLALEANGMDGAISRIVVYRSENEGTFRQLVSLSEGATVEFTDSGCKAGNQYTYKYRIFYQNGLKSGYSPEETVLLR